LLHLLLLLRLHTGEILIIHLVHLMCISVHHTGTSVHHTGSSVHHTGITIHHSGTTVLPSIFA
jgi:hypothetical protein